MLFINLGGKMQVKPAEKKKEHASLLMHWRNDPETVKFSRSGKKDWPQFYDEYLGYFRADVQPVFIVEYEPSREINPDTHRIASYYTNYYAFVKFKRIKDKLDIGVVVDPEFRGNGIGTEAIRLGTKHALKTVDKVYAEIKVDNLPSLKAFQKAGYRMIKYEKGFYLLVAERKT